jgi:hypothetical protein
MKRRNEKVITYTYMRGCYFSRKKKSSGKGKQMNKMLKYFFDTKNPHEIMLLIVTEISTTLESFSFINNNTQCYGIIIYVLPCFICPHHLNCTKNRKWAGSVKMDRRLADLPNSTGH